MVHLDYIVSHGPRPGPELDKNVMFTFQGPQSKYFLFAVFLKELFFNLLEMFGKVYSPAHRYAVSSLLILKVFIYLFIPSLGAKCFEMSPVTMEVPRLVSRIKILL